MEAQLATATDKTIPHGHHNVSGIVTFPSFDFWFFRPPVEESQRARLCFHPKCCRGFGGPERADVTPRPCTAQSTWGTHRRGAQAQSPCQQQQEGERSTQGMPVPTRNPNGPRGCCLPPNTDRARQARGFWKGLGEGWMLIQSGKGTEGEQP